MKREDNYKNRGLSKNGAGQENNRYGSSRQRPRSKRLVIEEEEELIIPQLSGAHKTLDQYHTSTFVAMRNFILIVLVGGVIISIGYLTWSRAYLNWEETFRSFRKSISSEQTSSKETRLVAPSNRKKNQPTQ